MQTRILAPLIVLLVAFLVSLGWVGLVASTRDLLTDITRIALAFLALGAFSIWLIARYYQRTLIRPLQELNAAFRSVAAGNLDLKVALAPTKDELYTITRDFNRMTEAMRESRRDLKAFVAVAAHDLRSPLATIRGYCEVLKDETRGGANGDIQEIVERIDAISVRSLELMDSLLTLERVESAPVEMQPVALSDVIRESLENLNADIDQTHARIDMRVEGRVRGDHMVLRGLFQNLIGNSLKYRRPDVEPRIRIESDTVSADAAMVRIRVSDNGRGFDNDVAAKIFAPFTRLDPSGTEGYGIGLTMVRRIVQRHNGRISARGEPGRGAEFTIDLPASL